MVFTHLPSAIALALIPVPSNVHFAILFIILRSCTQSMDVAPRSAFLAAVVLPNERTAVMGLINVVKTLCTSIGPSITGVLAKHGLIKFSFFAAGALKATYDLGVLAVFAGREMRENQAKKAAARAEAEAQTDGEADVQNGNGAQH
jgi:sugar phosphate permease